MKYLPYPNSEQRHNDGVTLQELVEAVEEAAGAAGVRLHRLERKAERPLVAARRAALASALAQEGDPAAALALAVPLLVAQARFPGCVSSIEGSFWFMLAMPLLEAQERFLGCFSGEGVDPVAVRSGCCAAAGRAAACGAGAPGSNTLRCCSCTQ